MSTTPNGPEVQVDTRGISKIRPKPVSNLSTSVSNMLRFAGFPDGEFKVVIVIGKNSSNTREDQIRITGNDDESGVAIDSQVGGHRARFECRILGNGKYKPEDIAEKLQRKFPDGVYYPKRAYSVNGDGKKSVEKNAAQVASKTPPSEEKKTYNWPQYGESLIGRSSDPEIVDPFLEVLEEMSLMQNDKQELVYIDFTTKDATIALKEAGWSHVDSRTVGQLLVSISNKSGRVKVASRSSTAISWICVAKEYAKPAPPKRKGTASGKSAAKKSKAKTGTSNTSGDQSGEKLTSYVGFSQNTRAINSVCRLIFRKLSEEGDDRRGFMSKDIAPWLESHFEIKTSSISAGQILMSCVGTGNILTVDSAKGVTKAYMLTEDFVRASRETPTLQLEKVEGISIMYLRSIPQLLVDKFYSKPTSGSDGFAPADLRRWLESEKNIKVPSPVGRAILKELERVEIVSEIPRPKGSHRSLKYIVTKKYREGRTSDIGPEEGKKSPALDKLFAEEDSTQVVDSNKLNSLLDTLPHKAREVVEAGAVINETDRQLADLEERKRVLLERKAKYELVVEDPKARKLAALIAEARKLAEEIDEESGD